jgi:hypothetical protein
MGCGDRSADRKSHAEAFGLCRAEAFEDAFRHGGSGPVPVSSTETTTLPEAREHPELPGAFGDPDHRFDAIHVQVQQYLPQLNSIAEDG